MAVPDTRTIKISEAIALVLDTLGLGDKTIDLLVTLGDALPNPSQDEVNKNLLALDSDLGGDENLKRVINLMGADEGFLGFLNTFIELVGIMTAMITATNAPIGRRIEYAMERRYKTARLDPGLTTQTLFRHPEDMNAIRNDQRDLGMDDNHIKWYESILTKRIDEDSLFRIYKRGDILFRDYIKEMKAKGWDDENLLRWEKSRELRAGLQDTIRFAVKGAYSPEEILKFETLEDIPQEFLDKAEELNYNIDDAKREWIAHWQLPGPQQAATFMHRFRTGEEKVKFNEDDFATYLKAADISKFWRELFVQSSFRLIPRIDIRRAVVNLGWDRNRVLREVKASGWDGERAETMADIAMAQAKTGELDITQGNILSAYEDGTIVRDHAASLLSRIGVDEYSVQFKLMLKETDIRNREVKDTITYLKTLFVEGQITETTLTNEMNKLNLTGGRLNRELTKIKTAKNRTIKIPSKADNDKWYSSGVITQPVYRDGLVRLNYPSYAVNLFIHQINENIQEKAQKDLIDIQKEQERLRKQTVKRKFQQDKADLNLDIAWLKLQLADLNVAMALVEDKKEAEDLGFEALDISVLIEEKRVELALIKVDLEQTLGIE